MRIIEYKFQNHQRIGKYLSAHFVLSENDRIKISRSQDKNENLNIMEAKKINLNIMFEDDHILVINKQAGLITHLKDMEDKTETLVNALINHTQKLSDYGGNHKLGIVHRLDKDTSGLMIIAKTNKAHKILAEDLKERQIKKYYLALVQGHIKPLKGAIESPISRDPANRTKMKISSSRKAKFALSHYRVLKYFTNNTSLIEVQIITGRTHQIRVHFSSIGFPIIGDQKYGRKTINKTFFDNFNLQRQFLHAYKLEFNHPTTGEKMAFESELPEDLKNVICHPCKCYIIR